MDIELKKVNDKIDILGDVTRKQLKQTELLQDAMIRLEASMLEILMLYRKIKLEPEVSRRTKEG